MEGIHPLKTWRRKQRPPLSQDEVAEKIGVTKPTISRWERYNREPSLADAAKLSEITGIPLKKFVRAVEAA